MPFCATPSVPFTHSAALGFTLLVSGRNEEAITAFRQAIRLDRRFRPASVGLGQVLLANGEFGPAGMQSAAATVAGTGRSAAMTRLPSPAKPIE